MADSNTAVADSKNDSGKSKGGLAKVITASMTANALEWYDYALYGIMAPLIAHHFFPSGNETVQLLATYGVFAAGFMARPLGAVFFGWFGDKYGRKMALVLAIVMMAIPTACIGLLPGYASIGMAAPILLTLIRILQGLSLGGAFSGSITYMVEHAPGGRRGLLGSMSMLSLVAGFLLGSVVATGTAAYFGEAEFNEWGWRLPFIFGLVVGFVAFFIQKYCEESPMYEEASSEGTISKTPLRDAFTQHPGAMLRGFGMYLTVTVPFYLSTIYFVTYTNKILGHSMDESLELNTLNMVALFVTIPISAILSDKYGRRNVLLVIAAAMLVCVYPIFNMFADADIHTVAIAQILFACLVGLYLGPMPAVLVELFPTAIRFTGMALSYNFAATLFGGTTPMVSVWLIDATGNNLAIAYYVMICNVLSIVALWKYKDRFKEPLS